MSPVKAALVAVAAVVLSAPLSAESTSAQFLDMGWGARYLAMGEAATAVADDANALYWNPANLTRLKTRSLTLMYSAYVEEINSQNLAYAQPTVRYGSFAGGVHTLSAGSIRQTDDTGREINSFSPRDTSVSLGWGFPVLRRIGLGVSAKYIRSEILNTASTWAVDTGLGWKFKKVSAGAAVRNIGGKLKYDREEEKLPLSYHLGAAYQLTKPWLVSAEGIHSLSSDFEGAVGMEYRWLGKQTAFALRAGYNSTSSDVPGFSGASFGAGFTWNKAQIDYAWIPLGDLDQTHRISLTFGF